MSFSSSCFLKFYFISWNTLTDFRSEDDVLLMKVKKLYADETGVDVMSTSAGQYSTAGKYKVKKPKEFSPGCE